jgi:hypothetical protein
MKDAALSIFHRPPERFNCAQAVAHAYRTVSGDETCRPEDFKGLGGGHAPGGTCGALYAACQACPGQAQALAAAFNARAGSTLCKELKASRVPCETCVALAADLLAEALKG